MTRRQKQINIILFFLLLIIAMFGVVFFATRPEMTCNDGLKNQGEEGVDCGGPCQPCLVKPKIQKIKSLDVENVDDGRGGKDLLIKFYNPNHEYGAKNFQYLITDQNGQSWKRYDFILPGETKLTIVNNLKTDSENFKIKIDDQTVQWMKVIKYLDPKLTVYNKEYRKFSSGANFSEVTGLLVNDGPTDYENVKVKAFLRDINNKLLAVNHHIINTLKAGGKREFHIIFPEAFPGEVAQITVEVETNVFDSDNYVKVRGGFNYIDQ